MFKKETYMARRAALLQKMQGEKGIMLFIGNVESPAQYRDNAYKWRQDGSWLYFWGIDEPGLAATIDIETGEETLYGNDFDLDDIIWTGPMPTIKELAQSTGISKTAPLSALEQAVKGKKIHFLPASRSYNALQIAKLTGLQTQDVMSAGKAGCKHASAPMLSAAIEMRLVKTPEEIVLIDKACDLGYEMHTVARKGIRPGRIEQQIVGEMEGAVLSKGWGTSFPTILTQHGEVFHCHSHALPIEPGRLMVIDAGAELNEHYCSDFTRTYPTCGKYTPRQRDIYDTVYDCNELAFSLIAPGISYRDVHLAVNRLILERFQTLGLILPGNIDDMVADGLCGLFLPHGLGHNMGLECHDMEDYGENLVGYDPDQQRSTQLGLGSLRMARRLKPGNVITDEPGIYFIPALIEQWKAGGIGKNAINYPKLEEYYNFGGIRIEDDILVTETGARRLGSKRLPASSDEVENAMAQD